MWRKTLLLVGVLVLALATIGPAFAQPGPKDDKTKGPAVAGTPAPLRGQAFQAVITQIVDANNWKVDSAKYGADLSVAVGSAAIQWPGRKNATGASFTAGDRVLIQLAKLANKPNGSASNLVARRVHLIPGSQFIHFTGELIAFGGDWIEVKNGAGDIVKFGVDANATGTSVKRGPELWLLKDYTMSRLGSEWKGKQVTVVARDWTDPKFATAIVLHGAQAGQETDDDQGKVEGIGISQAPGQSKDKNKDKVDD